MLTAIAKIMRSASAERNSAEAIPQPPYDAREFPLEGACSEGVGVNGRRKRGQRPAQQFSEMTLGGTFKLRSTIFLVVRILFVENIPRPWKDKARPWRAKSP